jgi:hypothetical protein
VLEGKIQEMWARTSKLREEGTLEEHLPEQMEFFAREVLPLLALKGFFQGVGNLDQDAANTVLSETGKLCGGFTLASLAAGGLEVPTQDVDAFLEAHAKAEDTASGGKSTLTREGDAVTIVIEGGCVCPLVKTLKIEASPNHCLCTTSHLKHLYETGLGRPVEVDLIETCLRGGNACTIKISW